jgi:hypothetical protein
MAILLKVQWVDKSDQLEPHQQIRHIGGVSGRLRWKYTQAQAIESIERGMFAYYVEKDARSLSLVVGQTSDGQKFLTLPENRGHLQFLLELPEFPSLPPAKPAKS